MSVHAPFSGSHSAILGSSGGRTGITAVVDCLRTFCTTFSLIPTAIEATSFAPVIVALTTSLVALNVTSAAWVAIEVSRSETFGLSSSKVTISGISGIDGVAKGSSSMSASFDTMGSRKSSGISGNSCSTALSGVSTMGSDTGSGSGSHTPQPMSSSSKPPSSSSSGNTSDSGASSMYASTISVVSSSGIVVVNRLSMMGSSPSRSKSSGISSAAFAAAIAPISPSAAVTAFSSTV